MSACRVPSSIVSFLRRSAGALALVCGAAAAVAGVPDRLAGWQGPRGQATPEQVLAGQVPLAPVDLQQSQPLDPAQELWLRVPVPPSGEPLVLEFPSPIVDSITVHQRVQGRWTSHTAGDHWPQRVWPVAGRYPVFPIAPGAGIAVVQVRHATALRLPAHLVPQSAHLQHALLEYLGLGIAFGAIGLLMAHCVWRAWRLHDRAYLLLAATAALMLLSMAAITGAAAHLLWPGAGRWADLAQGSLAVLTAGMVMLVTGHLTAAEARMPRLGRVLALLGMIAVPVAGVYVAVPRSDGLVLLGAYVFTAAVLGLLAAARIVPRGDAVGRWMLMGAVPLTLAVFVSLGRSLGWVDASWLTDYGLVLGVLFNLTMLLGAVNSRSRDRRTAQLRQQAAGQQDPLTGLPRSGVFYARALHALRRWAAHREPVAIGLVEIANLQAVKAARGAEAGEESILRAVILLREVLRDVDTAGRLGEGRFGVLLEGAADRARATDCAMRLIAAGLRESEGGEPPLRFHVAFVLPGEYDVPPEQMLRELAMLLSHMSPRTRRQIRFLTADTLPAGQPSDGLEVDSAVAS